MKFVLGGLRLKLTDSVKYLGVYLMGQIIIPPSLEKSNKPSQSKT